MNNLPIKIKIVAINGRYTHSCLALFYVRNELEEHCPEALSELCQFTINDNYYKMLLQLTEGEPDYIFFSAAIWNSTLVEKLIIDIQRCLPACGLVIGGPQAEVLAEHKGGAAFTIVTGAIESVEPQFFHDLQNRCLQKSYGRSFFAVTPRNFKYPYREADFLTHLKNRHIYFETSRGCPFSCAYCLSASEKGLFHKDFETLRKELTDLLAHGPKVVRFIDRTFNDIPERALQIWQLLKELGGDTLFHFEMAPDRITEEMFEFLENLECGRFQFEIGIQSTNLTTLDAVNRRIEPTLAQKVVGRLAKIGTVHLHIDLILGLPFETRDTFAKSFRDVFFMGVHYIQMGLLKILPDTPIFHEAGNYGYEFSKDPPYSILSNKWLRHNELSSLFWFSECVEKFMNNRYFVSLWNYLRINEEDIFLFFEKLHQICNETDFFQRAVTQELMVQQLVRLVETRKDAESIIEILQYDWLRCGFRFLPESLAVGDDKEQPNFTRSQLYQNMPPELPGVYMKNTRNQFFRKSFFLRLAPQTLSHLGLETEFSAPCLCVLQDKEAGMYGYNKIRIFDY